MVEILGKIRQMKWCGGIYLRQLYYPYKFRKPFPILGRYACLGAAVMHLLQPEETIINVQKGRVDYLSACWSDYGVVTKPNEVITYMQREAIIPCLIQEKILYDWQSPKQPLALFMDSMAELGDQMFVHKDQGWRFLCAYNDLNHSDGFKREFRCEGLLPLAKMECYFDMFFRNFRKKYGDIPIFYLHFPPNLEVREKFIKRHDVIREVIEKMTVKFQPFFSLSADNSAIHHPDPCPLGMESYAYHYNSETYSSFVSQIQKTGAWLWSV